MKIIKSVLSTDVVKYIRTELDTCTFEDGRSTSTVKEKKNQQAFSPELASIINTSLQYCQEFQRTIMPLKCTTPMFCRYRSGDYYGPHFDSAINEGIRADVSITIALSNETEYSGGELRNTDTGKCIKANIGQAIVYDSDSIHEVLPVVSGERLVVVFWVQSRIKDSKQRFIVSELDEASRRTKDNGTRFIYNNLLRMWAE